jgi:hypothetical protein
LPFLKREKTKEPGIGLLPLAEKLEELVAVPQVPQLGLT